MRLAALLLALSMGLCIEEAQAQNYPHKPIRLIVPFAPGGTTDIVARILAGRLAKELGQPILIENHGGGGGSFGAAAVARAQPDGYTLGVSTVSTHAVNAACNPKLEYDPVRDFAPVTNMARTPNVLTVTPAFPVRDFRQFLAHVRNHPDRFSYATSGTCSVQHMVGEQFKLATGTQLRHIPYGGAGPALNDLLAGEADMMFDNLPSSMAHIQAGRLRALAIASSRRLTALPKVPTFAELGLKQVNGPAWYGLVAPANTPPEVIRRLHAAVVKVLAYAEVNERLLATGAEPVGNSPAEHAEEIEIELERMKNLVRKKGMKFDGGQ